MIAPAFETGHVKVYLGDALATLREIPSESIDCCVTSPPYWGLRAYGTFPQIWDGDPYCAHQWTTLERQVEESDNWTQAENGDGLVTGEPQTRFRGDVAAATNRRKVAIRTDTCVACGAWRGEYGLEPTLALYVAHTVEIFRQVHRVLRPHGTLWLNIGDSYAQDGKWGGAGDGSLDGRVNIPGRAQYPRTKKHTGLKPKDMVGMPWRIAFALQEDGWYLRSDIIWAKPNPMPESVADRPTKAHEYVFLFAKSERYYYDAAAIAEPLTASSMARISQASFDSQKGGPKDYGPTSNRSARKAIENLHARTIVPEDPEPGPLWNQGGENSRFNVDRDPRHVTNPTTADPRHGEAKRRLYKTDEHNRFGKASANRVWDDTDSLNRMIENGRNARTVWEIATQPYPEAHFATFPEELPRRCISAGAPEWVCTTCSTARERIVVATGGLIGESWHNHENDLARGQRGGDDGHNRAAAAYLKDYKRQQRGWTDCGHASYVPGTVLDPFAGSGTTLAVARDLGRQAIGIELHADYLDLIVRRCQQEALPWRE